MLNTENKMRTQTLSKKSIDVIEKSIIFDIGGEKETYFVKDSKKRDRIKKAFDFYSLSSGKIKFKKTGREISDKLNEAVAKIEDKKNNTVKRLSELFDLLSVKPTEPLPEWYAELSEMSNYKLFSWEELNPTTGNVNSDVLKDDIASPHEKIGKLRREWNDSVRTLQNTLCDLKKVKLFKKEIDKKASYELSLNELAELGF